MRSALLVFLLPAFAFAQGTQADFDRANKLDATFAGKVFRSTVDPHWYDGDTKFWYRIDLPGGKKEFVIVDAAKGTRTARRRHHECRQPG